MNHTRPLAASSRLGGRRGPGPLADGDPAPSKDLAAIRVQFSACVQVLHDAIFLKLGGLSLAGLAFQRVKPCVISFDDADIVRVATNSWSVYSSPSLELTINSTWYRDDLLHVYKQVTATPPTPEPDQTPTPNPNPILVPRSGRLHVAGALQPVKTLLNIPLSSIPADAAIPAGTAACEVTVPWTSPWRYSKADGWQALEEPLWRLYYGSVHWAESPESGPPVSGYMAPGTQSGITSPPRNPFRISICGRSPPTFTRP